MLNVILIFGLLLNLVAGFLFIAGVEPIVWGNCGFFLPRSAPEYMEEPGE